MFKFLGEYSIPIMVSALLHGILLWVMIVVTPDEPEVKKFKPPNYVKAELVELKAQVKKKAEQQTKKNKKVDLTRQKREEELKKKKAAEAKRLAEKKKKEAAEKKRKAEAEKKRKAEREAAKKREAERLAREAAAEKERLEFEKALAAEERALVAEQQEIEANSYTALIKERISQKWSRPPSARRGMSCELEIELVPTGKVISVQITRSSGNQAFDRSAEQAVRAVDRFEELQNLDPAVFDKHFRRITFLFNPEDRRL